MKNKRRNTFIFEAQKDTGAARILVLTPVQSDPITHVDSFTPVGSHLVIGSHAHPCFMWINSHIAGKKMSQKEISLCMTFAELTRRPELLRICCRQHFRKSIKFLRTQQLAKLRDFLRESGDVEHLQNGHSSKQAIFSRGMTFTGIPVDILAS